MGGHAVVTGAAGFAGSHLVHALALKGLEVRALDMKPDPGWFRLRSVRYVRCDIRNDAILAPALQGADTVYHLASSTPAARAQVHHEVNVEAARGVARLCAAAGIRRLIHVSTTGVYGPLHGPPPREDSPTSPLGAYERSKLDGEVAVREAAAATGLDVILLRPTWVYGPGCPRTARLIRGVRVGHLPYLCDGRTLRHPLYVSDLADALLLAASASPELGGRTYNLGGPRWLELRELVETCATVLNGAPHRWLLPPEVAWRVGHTANVVWGAARRRWPVFRQSLDGLGDESAADIAAARHELQFEPGVELEDGIRRSVRGVQIIGT
jgi:nucleoside-diphosphate-sugar epimerase